MPKWTPEAQLKFREYFGRLMLFLMAAVVIFESEHHTDAPYSWRTGRLRHMMPSLFRKERPSWSHENDIHGNSTWRPHDRWLNSDTLYATRPSAPVATTGLYEDGSEDWIYDYLIRDSKLFALIFLTMPYSIPFLFCGFFIAILFFVIIFFKLKQGTIEKSVPALAKALKENKDSEVRRYAVGALGDIGPEDKEVVPALITALEMDRDSKVRLLAAWILGRFGPEIKETIPSLIKALKENHDLEVRRFAAFSLRDYFQNEADSILSYWSLPDLAEVLVNIESVQENIDKKNEEDTYKALDDAKELIRNLQSSSASS